MRLPFPRCKFADINTPQQQISHVASEIIEVLTAETDIERDREMMDVLHSCCTYFEIRESTGLGPGYVQDLRDWIVSKNIARGYYSDKNLQL
jgi:hypothetical protein